MSTIIRCSHKYDDVYNYNIMKDIEDENGFEVDILVRVKETYREARINYNENDYPAEHDFNIDYDSFEVEFNHHSDFERGMIDAWIEIHKEKGTFEDAFGESYFEIEHNVSSTALFFYLGREVKKQETFKVDGTFESLYAATEWVRQQGYVYGSLCCDLPIALKKGHSFSEYNLPQKWKNMSNDDIKSVDGVIISKEFREGSVTVMLF